MAVAVVDVEDRDRGEAERDCEGAAEADSEGTELEGADTLREIPVGFSGSNSSAVLALLMIVAGCAVVCVVCGAGVDVVVLKLICVDKGVNSYCGSGSPGNRSQ